MCVFFKFVYIYGLYPSLKKTIYSYNFLLPV